MSRVVAFVALVLLGPFLLGLVLLLLVCQGKPVFFHQTRLGQSKQEFLLIKFRTMKVNDLNPSTIGAVAFEHPMVTPLGRWFRRLRLDELPQLMNIVKGDMVFVGPRPCLPGQEQEMTPEQRQRFVVKPGMTGLAEVSGNVLLTQDEQWNLDWRYVQESNVLMDYRICVKTIGVIAVGPSRNEDYVAETSRLIAAYRD